MSAMDKIKAKVDNVLHKDKTSDPTGPHDSHAANKADPRVDSDRIGTAGNTAGVAGGHGAGQYGSSTHTGTHGTHAHGTHTGTTGGLGGAHGTATHGSDPTGPHDSRMANKLDPRVDSDQYGVAGNTAGVAGGHGAGQYGSSTHTDTHAGGLTGHNTHATHTGAHTGTTGGLTGHSTHGTTGAYGSDPTGPHDSRMANKADPRVDSDRYGAAGNTAGVAGGHGAGQYGTSGTHATHGTHGAHGAHGTHGGIGGTVGSGNSNTTAGPHNSDMMNKLDPRVDSDLDGSKTVGGNATYR